MLLVFTCTAITGLALYWVAVRPLVYRLGWA